MRSLHVKSIEKEDGSAARGEGIGQKSNSRAAFSGPVGRGVQRISFRACIYQTAKVLGAGKRATQSAVLQRCGAQRQMTTFWVGHISPQKRLSTGALDDSHKRDLEGSRGENEEKRRKAGHRAAVMQQPRLLSEEPRQIPSHGSRYLLQNPKCNDARTNRFYHLCTRMQRRSKPQAPSRMETWAARRLMTGSHLIGHDVFRSPQHEPIGRASMQAFPLSLFRHSC
jgi:hypothetical protein